MIPGLRSSSSPGCAVGTIVDYVAHPFSGLATLVLRDDVGERVELPCEAGPTLRALGALTREHGDGHLRVAYETDEMGVLMWLAPVGEQVLP